MKREDILKDNNKLFASWAWTRVNGDVEYHLIDTNADCWISYDYGDTWVKIGTFIWGCRMGRCGQQEV